MNKKQSVIVGVVVIVLLAFGVWLGFRLARPSSQSFSPYSAVYLSTGDIYFGKLSWFPWPKISDVWYIERRVNPSTQSPELNVLPLKSVVWGPVENEISLNSKEIVFWARLTGDNRIAKAIENSKGQAVQNVPPSAFPQQGLEQAEPSASSSKK